MGLSISFSSLLAFLLLFLHHGQVECGPNKSCNYFEGSWVYDASYPIYNATSCDFIGTGFDCQKNGRPDTDYLKYRWQPSACNLPRFDGRDFLERNRGKKILFVGDSLSFNMWESLTCMLHSAIPNLNYTIDKNTFTFPEYEVSVDIVKNGFLVDLVSNETLRILKLDSISQDNAWKQADVLIFNSYHWWTHTGRLKTWDYYQIGDELIKDMDPMDAYKIAMTTWAKWVDDNIHPSKTEVFFQGVAAVHVNGTEWGADKAKDCKGETKPVEGSKYPGPSIKGEDILKDVISRMEKPVFLLNIALLTQLRKDGHPSIYGGNNARADCSHWCLAGVPDTWNQLLYAALLDI